VRLRHSGLYRALIEIDDGAHVSNYSEPIILRSRPRRRVLLVDRIVAGWFKDLAYCLTYTTG